MRGATTHKHNNRNTTSSTSTKTNTLVSRPLEGFRMNGGKIRRRGETRLVAVHGVCFPIRKEKTKKIIEPEGIRRSSRRERVNAFRTQGQQQQR